MTLTVRPARREDYAAVAAVAAELQAMHATGRPDVFRPGTNPLPEDYFVAYLDAEPPLVYVAEREGRVVGYALLNVRLTPDHDIKMPRRVATVEQIGVLDGERGSGAGRALMARAEAWAREGGADVLRLHVYEFNADALAFYARVGMTTESRIMELPLRGSSEFRVPSSE